MITTQTIKDEIKQARIKKDSTKLSILTTLLGDVENKLHNSNDTEVKVIQDTIKKFIKDASFTHSVKEDPKLLVEIELLKSFQPKELNENEITNLIKSNNFNKLPDVMMFFKNKNVDMRLVKKIFENLSDTHNI